MTSPRAIVVAALLVAGCERTTNLVSQRSPDAGPRDAGAGDAAPPWVLSDAGVPLCGSAPCACANGEDDDSDGFSDGFDGECTGPYDDDEATFATGEKTGNPHCLDCFYDGNGGPGDDGCRIAASCLVDGAPDGASGSCNSCTAAPECVQSCLPRTPNGCDCFGCCEVVQAGSVLTVQLVDSCSLQRLDDPTQCPRCQLAPDCKNTCGRCELCPGKTVVDLPDDCGNGAGPGYTCESGEMVCGAQQACPPLHYCVQGCCVPILL